MRRWSKVAMVGILVAALLGSAAVVFAAGPENAPPFRAGEVVVAGPPGPHLGSMPVLKYLPHADLTVVEVEKGREFGLVQRFRAQGRRAGLNLVATASLTPDDPYYRLYQWHFPAVQGEAAWDLENGVLAVVAVLDTGLATGGPDGIGCVTAGYDVVNGDGDPNDGHGHGTHVSGTVAQATNNATGVAGLAYGACVMPVKVLGDNGSGSFADIAEGIHYAVDNGADVINMSLGISARYGITSDPVMDPALDYAYANGVVIVAAAGNDGHRKNVSYPAIYSPVIAVGATDLGNSVTRYSNKGTGLDLVAPGGDTSKDLNGDGYVDGVLQETRINGSWGYYFFQGTSMAAPHVAAVAALLMSQNPTATPDEIFTALTTTALDLYEGGYDKTSGFGLVQAFRALTGDTGGADPGGGNPGGGTDADADGWTVEAGDCDDNNPDVFPGHQDSRGRWGRDGVDNDCNGIIDG